MDEVQDVLDGMKEAAKVYLAQTNGNVEHAIVVARRDYRRRFRRYAPQVVERSIELQIKVIRYVAATQKGD